MLIDAEATLVTTSIRSGTATVISMSGTLDRAAGAMVAAYLLDQADVASGDFHLDLRAVDLVEDAEVVLVTALHRRLAVRGHQLYLTPPGATTSAADSDRMCRRHRGGARRPRTSVASPRGAPNRPRRAGPHRGRGPGRP
jgi:hypothetical protein